MWNLKYGTNELLLKDRNRLTDIETKVVINEDESCGAGAGIN